MTFELDLDNAKMNQSFSSKFIVRTHRHSDYSIRTTEVIGRHHANTNTHARTHTHTHTQRTLG